MRRRRIAAIAGLGIMLGLVLIIVVVVVLPPGPEASPTTTASEYYEVGDWAETSQLMAMVVSAARTNSVGPYWAPETAPAAMVFIIIVATVSNMGDTPFHISTADFTVRDAEGRLYTSRTGTYAAFLGNTFPITTLAEGEAASGQILFLVPASASGLEITYLLPGAPPLLAIWELE